MDSRLGIDGRVTARRLTTGTRQVAARVGGWCG